jgi:Tol biopolymer transport system component
MSKTRREKVNFACMVVFTAVIVGAVQISFVFLLISLSSVLMVRPAFGQSSASQGNAGVRLEDGIAKEEADGDLKAAISVYQQIAGDSSAPRAVRAKALLRLGRCDEKLGQQARHVYEQIVRDYADQPVAAQARTRLSAMKQQEQLAAPATMTVRQLEMPPGGSMEVIDTDGRRAVYPDHTGNLYFADFTAHSKRLIFKHSGPMGSLPSRDFSSVLLEIPVGERFTHKFAVVNIDGSGFRELPATKAVNFFDWSRDKRFILATYIDPKVVFDRFVFHKIVLVDATDGSERLLATVDSNKGIRTARFSPDGRFVAFDIQPETGGGVFVVPIGGGQPDLLSKNSQLLDWTSDGRFLALSTSLHGAGALSLLSVSNGKPVGDPLFIRFGQFESGYITAKGSLVYSTTPLKGRMSLSLSELDGRGHPGPWQSLNLRLGNKWNPNPSWSPDSHSIVYTSRNDSAGLANSRLTLRDMLTSVEREIYTSNDELSCAWSSKPERVFCAERDKQRTDFLSIGLDSQKVERLGSLGGRYFILAASRDEDALYLEKSPGAISERWEIATGKIANLDDGYVTLSEDQNWLVRVAADRAKIEIRPMEGGNWRALASGDVGAMPTFTPDSHLVLFTKKDIGGLALFRVPVTGGTPQRLGDYPNSNGGTMRISPDGKKIIAASFHDGEDDLSILENFVPKAAKPPAAAR